MAANLGHGADAMKVGRRWDQAGHLASLVYESVKGVSRSVQMSIHVVVR
jgi:hypothetical protein